MANGIQAMQRMGGYQPQGFNVGQRNPFSEFFLGSSNRIQQIPTVTPEVAQALSQLLQGGLSGIQDPSQGFQPIAEQAQTQFQQQTIPSILERFTALGGQRSSALGQQLGAAGAGLQQDLAAQQAQYGLQNRQGLLQQLQLAMMPQFENAFMPGQQGFLSNLFSSLIGSGISSAAPGLGALVKGSVKNYLNKPTGA